MKGKVSLREWEKNLVRKQGDLHVRYSIYSYC